MSPEPVREPRRDGGRRNLLRALTGGGAAAALAMAAAPATPAEAATGSGTGADPFAAEAFRATAGGRVREYWVQADSFAHNAVPNGRDGMTGMTFTADQTTYQAIGYRAYTPNWEQPLPAEFGPHGIGANSGIPGPVLRAEVGDVIKVHFRNNDAHYKWPHTMHPHGVRYSPSSDGAWMADTPDAGEPRFPTRALTPTRGPACPAPWGVGRTTTTRRRRSRRAPPPGRAAPPINPRRPRPARWTRARSSAADRSWRSARSWGSSG